MLPIIGLEVFGFDPREPDPFEVETKALHRIGGGVEALAFTDDVGSAYKFFLFRRSGKVGATFEFSIDRSGAIVATAVAGTYRGLFQKLRIIHELGIPTETLGVTPEGIIIAKQVVGHTLPPGIDLSNLDPTRLIQIPSRLLRADRDYPRLAFIDDEPWLLADTHDRNVVLDENRDRRIIDLVAAAFPTELVAKLPMFKEWVELIRLYPHAPLLPLSPDDEL